jgi:hypothetical protein
MILGLVLLYVLAQSPPRQATTPRLSPSHLIALVFSDTDVQRMRLSDARKTYARLEAKKATTTLSDEDSRLYAALTIALGTLPDRERLSAPRLGTRERLDWEVRRGVRLPVQRKEKD